MKNFFIISQELFYTLTGALAIFVFLEIIWPGIVLAYFNVNWVLILWGVAGIVVISHNP